MNQVEATVKKDYKIVSIGEFIFWRWYLRVFYLLDK